ncbi:uncharacterized protein V1513DRAFT_458613 [Lipomyces chichibuensis]|uniref:uncharacterized protein n=1 Tax=Lipomyces chichibuensis TaxID=1546026 RepID=UPI0033434A56
MHFRRKRQQKHKKGHITSISKEDILNALPKDEDFRQSLILPSLAKQFPFLLNADETIFSDNRKSNPQKLHVFSYRVPIPEIQAMPSKPSSVLTGASASQIWNKPQQTDYVRPLGGSAQNTSYTDNKAEPSSVDQSTSSPRRSIHTSSSKARTTQSISSSVELVIASVVDDDLSVGVETPPPAMTLQSSEAGSCPDVIATTNVNVAENDDPNWTPSLATLVKRHLRNLSQSTTISDNRGRSAKDANDVEQLSSMESQLGSDAVVEEYCRRSRSCYTGTIADTSSSGPKLGYVPEIVCDGSTSLLWRSHRRHVEWCTANKEATIVFAKDSFIGEKIASSPVRNEVGIPQIPPRNPLRTNAYSNWPKTPWPLIERGTVTLVNLPVDSVVLDVTPVSPNSTLVPSPVTPTSALVSSVDSSPTSTTTFGSRQGSDTVRSKRGLKQNIRSQDISSPVFISSTNLDPSIPIREIDYHKMKHRYTLTVA